MGTHILIAAYLQTSDGAVFNQGFWHDHGIAVISVGVALGIVVAVWFAEAVRRVRDRANASVEKIRREASLRTSDQSAERADLAIDALASLAGHVAVIDSAGAILAINEAWTAFGVANGVADLARIGPSANYLAVCEQAARAGVADAARAYKGIAGVCSGRLTEFELEYRADGPLRSEWFQMKVTPLRHDTGGAVVSHRNITALKREQIFARERDLSMLVDALPIGVKILTSDLRGHHVNTAWLRMTGRPLEDELERNWLDDVHPQDRPACERGYRAAGESRRPRTLEYRIHAVDGTYHWLHDQVVPQFDENGVLDVFVSASLDITDRRSYEAQLHDLTHRLVTAQEDERRRIARELHDDVNQRLALLAIGIDQASAIPEDDGLRETLRDLFRQTTEVSKAVHDLSHELHSSTLEALGLVSAIRTLSRELGAKGLRVALVAADDCNGLRPDVALALFRIVQEALSNVLKHSGVTHAAVTLARSEKADQLVVRVEDRGSGFNPAVYGTGLGLVSMRERLTPFGGAVDIVSTRGEGTVVEARVPREAGAGAASPRPTPTCAA